jgi:uncharacterized protein DUF3168
MLTRSIFDRLSDDVTLAELLGIYQDDPCVFSGRNVPEDAPRPYIWIQPPSLNRSWNTKNSRGREVRQEVIAVTDNHGSTLACDAIGNRIRALLDRSPLDVDGDSAGTVIVVIVDADGPIEHESDESVIARRVSVHAFYPTP